MSRWTSLKDALLVSFKNWRLWLIQFVGNVVFFFAFLWYLQIGDAHWWQLFFQVVLIIAIAIGALVLHGGTLNYFLSAHQDQAKAAPVFPAFKKALRHVPAIAVWAVIFFLVRAYVGKLDDYSVSVPGYLRSGFPVWLRRMISEPALDNIYSGFVTLLRWVLLPGLLVPFALFSADKGFRGLIAVGDWGRTIRSLMYWLALLIAWFLGVYCIGLIKEWRLDQKTSTLSGETASLILRSPLAIALGIFAWFLACSMLGRRQLRGQSVAQPE